MIYLHSVISRRKGGERRRERRGREKEGREKGGAEGGEEAVAS